MPVYEFECACGEVIEEPAKMGTDSIICSKCGRPAPKIMSRCSFELKGGGWYADGYASRNSNTGSNKASKASE